MRIQFIELLFLPVIVDADTNMVTYLTRGTSHAHKHLNTSTHTKTEAANIRKCGS